MVRHLQPCSRLAAGIIKFQGHARALYRKLGADGSIVVLQGQLPQEICSSESWFDCEVLPVATPTGQQRQQASAKSVALDVDDWRPSFALSKCS